MTTRRLAPARAHVYISEDDTADEFVKAAYKFGLSVQLIQRVLREKGYNTPLDDIRTVLEQKGIHDDGFNCSRQSHIWKRYLSYIAAKFDLASPEEFKNRALEEAIIFFDIDEDTVDKFWLDLCEFHTHAPFGSRLHDDFERRFGPWVRSAFLDFGYNTHSLGIYLDKIGFEISRIAIIRLFSVMTTAASIRGRPLDRDLVLRLAPRTSPYPVATKDFWKAGFNLLGEDGIPQMMELTEIIGGCSVESHNIQFGQ